MNLFISIYLSISALSPWPVEYTDSISAKGSELSKETKFWQWVVIRNAGGCAIRDSAAKVVTWSATLRLSPSWVRQAVEEAWSDQSAGYVKPYYL